MGWFDKGQSDKAKNPNAPTKTEQQIKDSVAREQYNAGIKDQQRKDSGKK